MNITKSKTLNYHIPTERSNFGVSREEGATHCMFTSGPTSATSAISRQLSYKELQDLWLLLAVVISEWTPPQPTVWYDVNDPSRHGVL